MTAAQKKVAANFKKALAYRKQTGCSLKEAFAKVYGKKTTATKKAAPKKSATKKRIGVVGSAIELSKELQQYCDYSASDFLEQFVSGAQDCGFTEKQATSAITIIINEMKRDLDNAIDYVYNS
jgi:hypothetical protein